MITNDAKRIMLGNCEVQQKLTNKARLLEVPPEKKILDVTCGGRSIWFDKHHPAAVYCDKRKEEYHHLWKNASNCTLSIVPDVLCDFTALPFGDNSFSLVVFDPPHLIGAKETAWLVKKYGKLDHNWPKMLHDGFRECMRVLKPDGVQKAAFVRLPSTHQLRGYRTRSI